MRNTSIVKADVLCIMRFACFIKYLLCARCCVRHHGEQNRHHPCLCRVDCLLDIIEGKIVNE